MLDKKIKILPLFNYIVKYDNAWTVILGMLEFWYNTLKVSM